MISKKLSNRRSCCASTPPRGFVEVLESRALLSVTAYEGFNYPRGTVLTGNSGGAGWANKWNEYLYSSNTAYDVVASGSLGYGKLVHTGNRLVTTGEYDFMDRTSSNQGGVPGTTTYVSYLIRQEAVGNGGGYKLPDYGGLELDDSAGNSVFVGKPQDGNYSDFGIENLANSAQASSTVKAQFMQTYLIVAGISWGAGGNDTVSLYVDPASLGGAAPPKASAVMKVKLNELSDVGISAGTNATWGFDEIRVGTSFADVTPVS